jgi:carbon storage regulator
MLVLTRRIGQIVMIDDEITVTLLDIKGAYVRLGITAPRSVEVYRKEIFDLRYKQKQAQGGSDVATLNTIKQLILNER